MTTDTLPVVRRLPPVEVESSRARYLTSQINHESGPYGLRTVTVEWLTDADPSNGGHPAGTIVTRLIRGHFGRGTGEELSETITRATGE